MSRIFNDIDVNSITLCVVSRAHNMTVRFISDTFTKHLFWLLSGVLLFVAIGWWGYSAYQVEDILTRQISLRAEVQSQQLAHTPSLVAAVKNHNAQQVTQLIDQFAEVSDADFITVSDKQGIRLAHPIHERVGLPVMGGDIESALDEGKSYLSYASGSLGPSVRYISPIFDTNNDVIGMVKVGYLLDTVETWNSKHLMGLVMFGISIILVSVVLAIRFSAYVKKNMQDLEPWQLRQALVTQQGVLQAAHEGLLAVNEKQQVYVVNESAKKLLGCLDCESNANLSEWVDSIEEFTLSGEDFLDRLVRINGQNCVMTRITIPTSDNEPKSAVFSLRASAELRALSDTLSQVGGYIENLRVTRHEYQNKLSILAGLLQLGQHEQALQVVLNQSRTDQQVLDKLKPYQKFPQLSGLLLAKLLKAKERQVEFMLPDDGHWTELPPRLNEEKLCSIVGNLIDNSLDALDGAASPTICLNMWRTSTEFGLSVTNNGPEVQSSLEEIAELGYTTKQESIEHGIGLYVIQSMVDSANGHIELDSDEHETSFTLYFHAFEEERC